MRRVGRRSFLAMGAVSVIATQARTLRGFGLQLYTVRRVLRENPLAVLQAVEAIGYREAELVADDLQRVWPALRQTSLRPVSIHLPADLFTHRQAQLPAALEDARRRELQYVVCPWVAPEERGGADRVRRLADTLNKAGDHCHRLGLRLCYHNHAFDFAPAGSGTLLDVLMQTADPKLLGLELDVMWARVAGVDPVRVIQQYGDRVVLMHLKNVAEGIVPRYDENIPAAAFREVGNGVVQMPEVLQAAAEAGVRHYFVEQDETPGDPLVSLRKSYTYLEQLNF